MSVRRLPRSQFREMIENFRPEMDPMVTLEVKGETEMLIPEILGIVMQEAEDFLEVTEEAEGTVVVLLEDAEGDPM